MANAEKEYDRLMNEEGSDTDEVVVLTRNKERRPWVWPVVAVLLLLSFGLNAFQALCTRPLSRAHQHGEIGSTGAGLDWDVDTVYQSVHSPYKQTDRAAQDEVWGSDLVAPWRYTVALDSAHVESLGLGSSVRWPWDEDKQIYIMQAGHQIHCLHSLRGILNSYNDGKPIEDYPHAMHCLDILMQSVMCYADDGLLYVGFHNYNANQGRNETPAAGEGSPRTCRDFKKLRSWADEHSACYDASYERNNHDVKERERYKFCPDGSRPWEDL